MSQNRNDQDPKLDQALDRVRKDVAGLKLSTTIRDLSRQLREALEKPPGPNR
ncbi:hypothetical protein [Paracoccus beibuensis]|uniref:hypothetical protein n=1 Tax=Paracoccus beibuensis TaxID=547602 RepID=UPI0022406580|nr:hypothetical protein [Paracoccus beibuensis]